MRFRLLTSAAALLVSGCKYFIVVCTSLCPINFETSTRFSPSGGAWSDTAADDSRMFLRDASGRDIYALDVDFP